MKKVAAIAFLIPVIMITSGCGPEIELVNFDPLIRKNISTIGVVNIKEPPRYDYGDYDPWIASGLGAIAMAGSNEIRANDLSQALKEKGFNFKNLLESNVKRSLQQAGYDIQFIEVPEKVNIKFLENYDNIRGGENVDSYMDFKVNFVGVYHRNDTFDLFPPYVPHIDIQVRLIDAKTKDVQYSQMYLYGGNTMEDKKWVRINPDSKYVHQDFHKMKDQPDNIIECLNIGAEIISNKIVDVLKSKNTDIETLR